MSGRFNFNGFDRDLPHQGNSTTFDLTRARLKTTGGDMTVFLDEQLQPNECSSGTATNGRWLRVYLYCRS